MDQIPAPPTGVKDRRVKTRVYLPLRKDIVGLLREIEREKEI